jgi:hypothetical protein
MEPITLIIGGATAAILGGGIVVEKGIEKGIDAIAGWFNKKRIERTKNHRSRVTRRTHAPKTAPKTRPASRPKPPPIIMFHGTEDIGAAHQILYEGGWRCIGKNTPDTQPKGIWLTPSIDYAKEKAKGSGAIIIVSIDRSLWPELKKESDDRYVREIWDVDPSLPHVIAGLIPIGILDGYGQRRLR